MAVLDLIAEDVDRAVQGLRRALAIRPDDPRLLNDLAAALLAQAEATGDLRPELEALDAAERSISIRPSLAALFNGALARERLGLRACAITIWRQYLELDDRSDWAGEAAERIDRLEGEAPEGPVVAELLASPETELAALGRNLWADRQLGERTLLTRWAERSLAGDQVRAEAALVAIENIASRLSAGGGRLLAASAAAIREAEAAGDQARLSRLARGHEAFARAFRLHRAQRFGEAHALLEDAIDDLRAAGSPFELRARLLRVASALEPDWPEIQGVERAAEEQGFPALVAESRHAAAYRVSLEGRLDGALEIYDDARRRFLDLGESEPAAVIAAMRAELFETVGNDHHAMSELALALAGAASVTDAWNRYSIYVVAAYTALPSFAHAAVELRREAAEVCRDLSEQPLCAVDSALGVARLTPDAEVADEALTSAAALLADVSESHDKPRTAIDLMATRARWLGGKGRSAAEQEEAAELYAVTAERYRALGLTPSAAWSHAERAGVLERLGRAEDSAAEYRTALRMFRLWDRTERFRPADAERRVPRDLRGVYERLMDLELGAAGGAPSRVAFLLSEEMRERLAPRRTAELDLPRGADLDGWVAVVPAGTAIVEYALTGERATAWILVRGDLDQVALAPGARLAKRVESLARGRDIAVWKDQAGALYDEILAPVLERLPAGTVRLIVVPDGELYGVPFRALWDAASARFVDERLTVELAPSVRLALGALDTGPAVPPRPLVRVLSAGFGEFAPGLGLDPLPLAGAEAAAIRDLYGGPSGTCPVDRWEDLRRCAPHAPVIHFATHAAAGSTPTESWLAFPEETVTLERLWRELPDLPARPVVVLSSCQSVAAAGGGEGLGGLARPFLANGARAVVGTLWKLDDQDAADLFPAFHRAYRESSNVAEALREARQRLDGWRERPWVWGGVEVVASEPRE